MIDPWTNRRSSLLFSALQYHTPLSTSLYPSFSRLFSACFDNMAEEIQLERAINEIRRRRQGPAPNIDFTRYQLEDGPIVSTQERVVKEVVSSRS